MMRKYKKLKKIVVLGAALALTIGAVGCGSSSGNTTKTEGITASEVRIATQPSVLSATSLLAKVNGYLEEELEGTGVKITWTSFENGPSMNESFAAGQQDIGVLGDVPLLLAKANGQENSVFVKAASGEKTVALVGPEGAALTDFSELKGKKIGYVVGSYAHHFLYLALEKGGLTLDDVESVNLGNSDIPAAIEANEIDYGVIWEPVITSGVNDGRISIVADGTNLKRNNVYYNIVTEFAEENPEIAKAYIRAVKRAGEFIEENPEEAAEALKDEIALDTDLLAEVLSNFDYSVEIDDTDLEQLEEVADFNHDQGLTDGTVDVKEFVLTTYLDEVLD